jgi:DNA mismatch repair protein MutS
MEKNFWYLMNSSDEKISPMMLQWHTCKKKAKEAILLFRLGDFYEAFYQDAKIIAKELDLTLTKRQDTPMAGIPFHTTEAYIDKLVSKGYHVAIAEQMEDAKEVKGLVKRDIVRIITPGTVIQSSLLSEKRNNFLASVCILNQTFGLALLDLTTAECKVMEFESISSLLDEIIRLKPKEVLLTEKSFSTYKLEWQELKQEINLSITMREEWHFSHQCAVDLLTRHFGVQSLDGFGLQGMVSAINAMGSLFSYVTEELSLSLNHIHSLQKEQSSQYMSLDTATLRHLEILENTQEPSCTLLDHLDKTLTPMGGRLLKHWVCHPLLSLESIHARQDAVEFFIGFPDLESLKESLGNIRDIERLIMRIDTGFATPKDLLSLRLSLQQIPHIMRILSDTPCFLLQEKAKELKDVSFLTQKLESALQEQLPLRLSDGNIIQEGFNKELDELRALCKDSQTWIANYQTTLREETKIKTLKVGYTKAFGYFIEVSRGQSEKMPSSFQRRQTLVNAERFITEELKEYEHKVLSAEERISGIETALFHDLCKEVSLQGKVLRSMASAIAHIDCLLSLAEVSSEYRYIKPILDEERVFHIEAGRHPIVEAKLRTSTFIANDTFLDDKERQLFIITGPNMAGKSTFIRQVALISILAQIGCFVPAKKAHIGLIDKVFSRIGASDNLARGHSTFMVEMMETAHILHNATDRSLVILDEIGRGTSTYDGISLAWAIAEYLLTTPGKKAKTLFATHYYELTQMEGKIFGAINYNVAVHESAKGIVFLHKIVQGGTDKSYGIHVARLAGLPSLVLQKAQEMLKTLEKNTPMKGKPLIKKEEQLSFFTVSDPILEEIRSLQIDHITPIEALQKLLAWKKSLAL